MAHSVNVILLALGVLQGALLGLYLLRKQKPDLPGLYFILILLLVATQLTFKMLSKVWLWENIKLAYLMSYSLPYLAGPLLYLYVKARGRQPFSLVDLAHVIPFLVSIGICTIQYLVPRPLQALYIHPYLAASLQAVSILTYAWLSWRSLAPLSLPGLKTFVVSVAGCEVIISIALAVMYLYHPQLHDVRWLFILLTMFIYWVSYRMMEPSNQFQDATPHRKSPKYVHSSLKEEEAMHIAAQLNRIMSSDRAFTDATLTIDALARRLNTSRHHVSQVINERFGQRYHEFINEFRLNEARARLESGRYDHYTVSAIALDCGFGTVSNFNELFKKRYGVTPSQVRLQLAVNGNS